MARKITPQFYRAARVRHSRPMTQILYDDEGMPKVGVSECKGRQPDVAASRFLLSSTGIVPLDLPNQRTTYHEKSNRYLDRYYVRYCRFCSSSSFGANSSGFDSSGFDSSGVSPGG